MPTFWEIVDLIIFNEIYKSRNLSKQISILEI